jgi:hypothetical protein
MEEAMKVLWFGKTSTTSLHPQSYNTVELYVMTIEGHLRQVASTHQRNWGESSHIFLQAYRASTQETIGIKPTNMMLGHELSPPCGLLLVSPPDKEQSRLKNIQNVRKAA